MIRFLKSKTVWAGIIGAASVLVNAGHIGAVEIGQAVSILLGAVGVKDAISKVR